MKDYTNKHLLEVACTFSFNEDGTQWDSSFYGQYYDKIKENGFTKRQERKGINIEFRNNGNIEEAIKKINSSISETESQMIFTYPETKQSIVMANKYLSFHQVQTYKNWETFTKIFLNPLAQKYNELGLFKQVKVCQIVYLNRFMFDDINDNLAEYFTIAETQKNIPGQEGDTLIHKQFIQPNGIILSFRFNATLLPDNKKQVTLECGAFKIFNDGKDENPSDVIMIADKVKAPIRNFFECLITDKLRNEL